MGGKTSTSTSSVAIPPEVLARYQAVNEQAQNVSQTPFQKYSSDPNAFVAPLTSSQQAGVSGANLYSGAAQPFFQAATGLTQAGAGPANLGGLDVQRYLSPYLEDVYKRTLAGEAQQNAQQLSGLKGQAVQAGAFGGDRAGVAAANLGYQQNLANSQTNANILNSGFQQAQGVAQQQQGAELGAEQANLARLTQAGAQIAGLGAGAQTAGLQGAQAQLGAGQVEQQTQQAGLQALYNQFQQEKAYPFQTAQFLANIAEGTGAQSGSTTTTQQPSSFFSDERLKEDIEPVGETYDGQKIIKFRYRGQPGKQIGLSAQNVEQHHPEAVGLAGGYKTVDYDQATRDAAEMGRNYAGGGLVAANDDGGYGGMIAAGGPYRARLAPTQSRGLMVAPRPSQQEPTGAQQFNNAVGLGENVGKVYTGVSNAPKAMSEAASWGQRNIVDPIKGLLGPNDAGSGAWDSYASGGGVDDFDTLAEKHGGLYAAQSQPPSSIVPEVTPAQARSPQTAPIPGTQGPSPAAQALQTASGLHSAGQMGSKVASGIGSLLGPAAEGTDVASVAAPGLAAAAAPAAEAATAAGAAEAAGSGIEMLPLLLLARGGRTGFADGGSPDDAPDPGDFSHLTNQPVGSQFRNTLDYLLSRGRYTPPAMPTNPGVTGTGPGNMPTQDVPAEGYKPSEVTPFWDSAVGRTLQGYGRQTTGAEGEAPRMTPGLAEDKGLGQYGPPAPEQKVAWDVPGGVGSLAPEEATSENARPFSSGLNAPAPLKTVNVPSRTTAGEPIPTGLGASSVAATPPPATGGVGAAAPPPPPPKDDGKNWMQRNQDWLVPLLSGVGGMASSPSRYLGAALLQGVGAGAQSYETVQNQMQQREKVAAEAKEAENRAALIGEQAKAFPGNTAISQADALVKMAQNNIFDVGGEKFVMRSDGTPQKYETWLQDAMSGRAAPPLGGAAAREAMRKVYPNAVPAMPTPLGGGATGGFDSWWNSIKSQESGGNHWAAPGVPKVSSAGAIGLAQVMEKTGPEAAALAGLPWDLNRLKYDPAYNEALGKAYYRKQWEDFGDPGLAAAAYNAGPQNVRAAMEKARTNGGSYLDYLRPETRSYVPSVSSRVAAQAPAAPAPFGQSTAPSAPLDAGPGMPAKSTRPEQYSYTVPIGPGGEEVANREIQSHILHRPTATDQAAISARLNEIRSAATTAQTGRQQVLELAANLVRPDGPLATGRGIQTRADIANLADTTMRAFGLPPLGLSADLSKEQIAQKLTRAQSALQARGMGERAVGAMSALEQGYVTGVMTPEAIKQLLADTLIGTQRDVERGVYASKYNQLGGGATSLGRDVDQAFDRDHGLSSYQRDRAALIQLMTPIAKGPLKGNSPVQYIMGAPGAANTPAGAEAGRVLRNPALVEKTFNAPGVFRYFSPQVR